MICYFAICRTVGGELGLFTRSGLELTFDIYAEKYRDSKMLLTSFKKPLTVFSLLFLCVEFVLKMEEFPLCYIELSFKTSRGMKSM